MRTQLVFGMSTLVFANHHVDPAKVSQVERFAAGLQVEPGTLDHFCARLCAGGSNEYRSQGWLGSLDGDGPAGGRIAAAIWHWAEGLRVIAIERLEKAV